MCERVKIGGRGQDHIICLTIVTLHIHCGAKVQARLLPLLNKATLTEPFNISYAVSHLTDQNSE